MVLRFFFLNLKDWIVFFSIMLESGNLVLCVKV